MDECFSDRHQLTISVFKIAFLLSYPSDLQLRLILAAKQIRKCMNAHISDGKNYLLLTDVL